MTSLIKYKERKLNFKSKNIFHQNLCRSYLRKKGRNRIKQNTRNGIKHKKPTQSTYQRLNCNPKNMLSYTKQLICLLRSDMLYVEA